MGWMGYQEYFLFLSGPYYKEWMAIVFYKQLMDAGVQ